MERIKSASVAGMFYPVNKEELLDTLKQFQEKNKKDYETTTRAIIVPHAGYFYSGQLASEGFQYLDKNVKNIFIIAPSHHVAVDNPVLSDYEHWQTPLGEISINQKINKELIDEFGCQYLNEAFEKEHAAEVQVPFIQFNYNDEVKIIPILLNYHTNNKITDIISKYYDNEENAFIISSDLSHFHSDDEAKKIDNSTANMIEMMGVNGLTPHHACGSAGICALHNFAQTKDFSLIRIGMTNSSLVSGDKNRVVGYGAWLLYEGKSTEFVAQNYKEFILETCRKSIKAGLEKQQITIGANIPPVFYQLGAAFVTLNINRHLRGCIGSIVAHQPLIIDLAQHAYDAAFRDNRFRPLSIEEFDQIDISVSLLSSPTKINFKNEQDLLDKITPFEDGIIIKDDNHQAVYLPSVWEQIPNKVDFLNNLKIKAGLAPNHFSSSFEAFKYSTVYIKEQE